MSETTESTVAAPETTDAAPVPVEPTAAAPETPAEAAPPPETAAEPAKPKQADRRFAHLTAKLASEAAAREAAERRAAAAEALLEAAKPPEERRSTPTTPTETVEQRATQIVAEREFAAKRNALIEAGNREMTPAVWTEKTDVLHSLGATNNQAFMDALVDLPPATATKLVAQLADDADGLVGLLAKAPAAIGVTMGRMAAELSRPAPAPRLSNAPRPAAPVTAAVVVPQLSIHDDNLSMAEWNRALAGTDEGKRLAARLGIRL